MEQQIKEKNQENNLLDFKLRDIARINESNAGYIKPHAGIHSGILSKDLMPVVAPTLGLKSNRGGARNHVISQSLEVPVGRLGSRNSHRSGISKMSNMTKQQPNLAFDNLKPSLYSEKNAASKSAVGANNKLPSHLRAGSLHAKRILKTDRI